MSWTASQSPQDSYLPIRQRSLRRKKSSHPIPLPQRSDGKTVLQEMPSFRWVRSPLHWGAPWESRVVEKCFISHTSSQLLFIIILQEPQWKQKQRKHIQQYNWLRQWQYVWNWLIENWLFFTDWQIVFCKNQVMDLLMTVFSFPFIVRAHFCRPFRPDKCTKNPKTKSSFTYKRVFNVAASMLAFMLLFIHSLPETALCSLCHLWSGQ